MFSCDTLGVCASRSLEKCNMMAKNSDRPICEAQPLVWIPAADFAAGTFLNCSGVEIPQAEHTFGVLGLKPYWIWGFETGINDQGVAIGNEAEFSRDFGHEKVEGLLGMDLLRLGLERGATARQALDVIVDLLERHGQNHNANALYDRRYENSFLIMDTSEIWVLETAGRRFAAKKISGCHALGNTYSIGENFDLASPDLKSHARENGWLMPYEPFNFERAYTAPLPYVGIATPRNRRVFRLADQFPAHSFETLKRIFRDHFDGELNEPRWGAGSGAFPAVCMHSSSYESSQTASSMLVKYRSGIGPAARVAFSQPCCSVYVPVYTGIDLPERMRCGEGTFDEKSLWWLMDRLAKIIALDYERLAPQVQRAAAALEADFEAKAESAEEQAAKFFSDGRAEEAKKILRELTDECSKRAADFAIEYYELIRSQLRSAGVSRLTGPRAGFLEKYCEISRMVLL